MFNISLLAFFSFVSGYHEHLDLTTFGLYVSNAGTLLQGVNGHRTLILR